ncbi:MAG: hypothetical protein ACI9XO_004358 [Paraglaciecola sp.]|jgi:hypothetical protein
MVFRVYQSNTQVLKFCLKKGEKIIIWVIIIVSKKETFIAIAIKLNFVLLYVFKIKKLYSLQN